MAIFGKHNTKPTVRPARGRPARGAAAHSGKESTPIVAPEFNARFSGDTRSLSLERRFGMEQPPPEPITVHPNVFAGQDYGAVVLPENPGSVLNRASILKDYENAALPYNLRVQLEQVQKQAQEELETVRQDLERLDSIESGIQETFATGTQFLEALGLPSTIDEVRKDPEIDAALNEVNRALQSGKGLDEALDTLSGLSEEEANDIDRAFGREQWLGEMSISIKNQVHNLVENRKAIKDSLAAAEDYFQLEAQAQEMSLWDVDADPSPEGRGYDVIIGSMEPWFLANYNGSLSQSQWDVIQGTLQDIWNNTPSVEIDPETGAVPSEGLDPLSAQKVRQLGGLLGLSPGKIEDLVTRVGTTVQQGKEAQVKAEGWKTAERLVPGEAEMATAINEVSMDLYDDPETARQMANSHYLHRIIQIRSKGKVDYRAGGNQFGLGSLPEHTYTDLGYKMKDVEGNAALQMEALLVYIGQKYGAGYDGLAAAFSDFLHNPDTWGDL